MEVELWLSAEDMAQLSARGIPGLPGTARGCRDKAQREGWPSRQVQGRGGPGGIKTLFRPPPAIAAAVNALPSGQEAEQTPDQSRAASDILLPEDDYQAWAATIRIAEEFVPIRHYRHARASAGHGAANRDAQPDALLFSKAFLRTIGARPANLFLVRVKGDSMSPTLQAGWTVVLDASRTAVSSGIYVVRLGEEEVCKRLEALPGGIVKVISDNRLYREYEIDTTQPGTDFAVLGQVIWFAGLVQ
ncbi:hypothetical protein E6C76_10035 [Pseudothauera nasutitermitis]|uniref:HTH Mu-type domain-containing protein n=1 Tax=Pseudothauera nasutitermitis TaxID=2565930 RepID=A0A4S4B064_9RHOO|nr:S24 family peptidase [Pseudothauera nasutitermitis]THF65868.1 hypothetical protein E6C76_10035 [Pseudothauera nasutitermitis]